MIMMNLTGTLSNIKIPRVPCTIARTCTATKRPIALYTENVPLRAIYAAKALGKYTAT